MGIVSRFLGAIGLAERSVPQPDTTERGSSGMGYSVGRGLAEKRLADLGEYHHELRGDRGLRIYDRMRLSDPKVAGLRRAQNLPLLSAGVRIEALDPKDKSPGGPVEVADFVHKKLLSGDPGGIIDPWATNLRQFLLHLDFGYAPFEIVWALQDGKAVIERFAYRPPSTIAEIYVERGRISRIEQQTESDVREIPGEKLLWFCHDREGDDFRGRSLLRPMYKPWYSKEQAEILLLVLLDKMWGVPVAKEVDGGMKDDAERKKLDAALKALHVSDVGYLHIPVGVDVDLMAANMTLKDGLELVKFWDQQLSVVAQQQFLDLGQTPNGSRAASVNLSDMWLNAEGAIAKSVEDTINAPEGPIHQLVAYNYPNSDDLVPKLRFASLGKLDLKALAEGLFRCHEMGMEIGEETWEWVREQLDLPTHEASDETAPQTTKPKTPPDEGAVPAPDSGPPAAQLSEGREYWRAPTPLESFVALDEISDLLDEGKQAIRTATQVVRDRMTADLVTRVQAAVESGDPAKVAALGTSKAPQIDALSAAIRTVLRRYFDAGSQQVADELARQQAGEPIVQTIIGDRSGQRLQMAATPARKRTPRVVPERMTQEQASEFYRQLDAQAEVAARAIGGAVVSKAADAGMRALGVPMSREVLETMVTAASDEQAIKAGMTVTRVMGLGRSAEANNQRDQIASAWYSAILDNNTCEECLPMDGRETEDLDEAASWTPNPDCLGVLGDHECRCMTIYEYKVGE